MSKWGKGKGYLEALRTELADEDYQYILALFDLCYVEGEQSGIAQAKEIALETICK